MEGKQNLLDAFAQEHHSLLFRTAQMSSRMITGSHSSCEVLVRFLVYTYYPSGHISMHHQRVTLFWKKHKAERFPQWRYAMIHISNGMEVDNRDTIYPTHFDEFERKHLLNHFETLQKEMDANRLVVRGTDSSTYYVRHEDLLYVCGGKGKFCDIYTQNGTIRVRLLIEQIRKYSGSDRLQSNLAGGEDVRLHRWNTCRDGEKEPDHQDSADDHRKCRFPGKLPQK